MARRAVFVLIAWAPHRPRAGNRAVAPGILFEHVRLEARALAGAAFARARIARSVHRRAYGKTRALGIHAVDETVVVVVDPVRARVLRGFAETGARSVAAVGSASVVVVDAVVASELSGLEVLRRRARTCKQGAHDRDLGETQQPLHQGTPAGRQRPVA
jgi:hypothetical protein